MKNTLAVLVLIFVVLSLFASCNSYKNEPAGPLTPEETPTPGVDGYYTASTAGVTFKWKVNGVNLDCKLSAGTTGWVAVGFNGAGQMHGADLKLGYVTGGTNTFMSDDFGSGHTHTPDSGSSGTNDITIVSGSDSGITTEIAFSIPLSSGDMHDYALTQGGSLWLLLARGAAGVDDFVTQHAAMGAVQVILY